MNNVRVSSRTFSSVVALSVCATALGWNSYDFESGFGTTSPGHGPFSYGTKVNRTASVLTPFTVRTTVTLNGVVAPYWWFNDNTFSRIYHNPSGTTLNFGEGTILPGSGMLLHPDSNRTTTVRFAGTAGANYSAAYRWTRLGQGGNVIASVLENGTLLHSVVVGQIHVPTEWFWTPQSVSSPLQLDFCVDQNGPASFDSTRLEVLVYENSLILVTFQMTQPEYGGSLDNHPVVAQVQSGKYPAPAVSLTTSSAGSGTFTSVFEGNVSIYLKPRGYLRKRMELDLDTTTDLGTITFVSGDIDDDNVIGVFDYLRLSDAFDSGVGDATWDPATDLDGDEVISVFDYLILSENFDKEGD